MTFFFFLLHHSFLGVFFSRFDWVLTRSLKKLLLSSPSLECILRGKRTIVLFSLTSIDRPQVHSEVDPGNEPSLAGKTR